MAVNLDPDLASTARVTAAWMAHCRSGLEKDEEDHGAPSHNIEAVDCDEKSERSKEELPKGLEANDGRLPPGMLWREPIAIWVCACLVWADRYRRIGEWLIGGG